MSSQKEKSEKSLTTAKKKETIVEECCKWLDK